MGLSSDESVVIAHDIALGRTETDIAQPFAQPLRIDGVEGVIGMTCSNHLQIEGLLADEDAAGSKDPVNFGKEAVLLLSDGHVMEH